MRSPLIRQNGPALITGPAKAGHYVGTFLLAAALLVVASAAAFADTVKITTDRALVWSRPNGVAVVITQLRRDDTVEVVRKLNGWYQIIVPGNSMSTDVRTGYISATQAVIDTVGPPSTLVQRSTTVTPRIRSTKPGTSFFNIDGMRSRSSDDLTEAVSVFTPKLDESTTFSTNYGSPTAWALDFMGGGPVWHSLGVGFAVGYHKRNQSAAINAEIPHPYFYDTLRSASFTSEPLQSREAAFHFPAIFMPPAFGAIKVLVFAGPSIFRLSQSQITNIIVNEQFPYDTVTITGVTSEEKKGTFWGYHAGADVSVFFNRSVGVGGGIRYSHANIKQFEQDAATTTGVAGGVSVVAGVRFRFTSP
jgi:opacity protein-like surface antigen